jgi:transcription termination/antitermination protein NusG
MSGSYGFAAATAASLAQDSRLRVIEPSAPQWFAIQVRYRFEKKAASQLNQKRCEVYLPMRTERHMWSDRKKMVTIPLFPGYAFVRIDQSREARQAVLKTLGVTGFVNFGGIVIAVPPKQIEDLQLLLREKGLFSMHSFEKVGQRVRIRSGCLCGLEGLLLQNEKGKMVISIESIQRSLAIEITGYELESI